MKMMGEKGDYPKRMGLPCTALYIVISTSEPSLYVYVTLLSMCSSIIDHTLMLMFP